MERMNEKWKDQTGMIDISESQADTVAKYL